MPRAFLIHMEEPLVPIHGPSPPGFALLERGPGHFRDRDYHFIIADFHKSFFNKMLI